MKSIFAIPGTLLLFAGLFLMCVPVTTLSAETGDKRFVFLEDGTVRDTKSGLNWAAKDNGEDITWSKAKAYCENYSAGGHNDWRMPTADELITLYGNSARTAGKDYAGTIDVITQNISITAPFVWSDEERTRDKSITIDFSYGSIRRLYRADGENRRALPVR